jgi:hypothetical protein
MLFERRRRRRRHLLLWLRRRRRFRIRRCEKRKDVRVCEGEGGSVNSYVGLMEVNFCPLLLFTHSLLMNSPVGWEYFLPFGAVSSMLRSDILNAVPLNRLRELMLE